MATNEWSMRTKNGLSAHFKQANGGSRPGVDWAIELTRAGVVYHVRVRGLLADDASRSTRKDEAYQARTAMQYLDSLLSRGWDPQEERTHVITIGNPLNAPEHTEAPAANRPWWKFW